MSSPDRSIKSDAGSGVTNYEGSNGRPANRFPLPLGAIAAFKVVTITTILILIVTCGIALFVVEPGHRLISGFVIGGMLTFIGLPFVLAAVQDEIERMHQ